MKLITQNFEQFIQSYLATASWVTCEPGECTDFTKEGKEIAKNDCKLFIDKVFAEFSQQDAERILNTGGNDLSHLAAHDFFLTRNGHGAGFWDKPEMYGEAEAKKLTEISKAIGETDCYHVRGKKSKLSFA